MPRRLWYRKKAAVNSPRMEDSTFEGWDGESPVLRRSRDRKFKKLASSNRDQWDSRLSEKNQWQARLIGCPWWSPHGSGAAKTQSVSTRPSRCTGPLLSYQSQSRQVKVSNFSSPSFTVSTAVSTHQHPQQHNDARSRPTGHPLLGVQVVCPAAVHWQCCRNPSPPPTRAVPRPTLPFDNCRGILNVSAHPPSAYKSRHLGANA